MPQIPEGLLKMIMQMTGRSRSDAEKQVATGIKPANWRKAGIRTFGIDPIGFDANIIINQVQ